MKPIYNLKSGAWSCPGDVEIGPRTDYYFEFEINGKFVKSGICKGSKLEKLPQFKNHDGNRKCFYFAKSKNVDFSKNLVQKI